MYRARNERGTCKVLWMKVNGESFEGKLVAIEGKKKKVPQGMGKARERMWVPEIYGRPRESGC